MINMTKSQNAPARNAGVVGRAGWPFDRRWIYGVCAVHLMSDMSDTFYRDGAKREKLIVLWH